MDRHIVVMKPICSLGHCECDSHTIHKLSQRRLTADLLSPRDVHDSAVRSPLTGCQVTSRPRDRFSRYPKWTDTFRTGLVLTISLTPWVFTAWYVIRYRKKKTRLRFSIIVGQTRSEQAEKCRAFISVCAYL